MNSGSELVELKLVVVSTQIKNDFELTELKLIVSTQIENDFELNQRRRASDNRDVLS